ncbi:MAG TPA: sulfite exporter TauE/SafE family protein [Candidatus Limnocylindria bacterium]|jgi:sulfite exporter TauE/SafE|nr:sulfite exporter TauE/SafE family protein [Candidatus Limnocylindria bacterium]
MLWTAFLLGLAGSLHCAGMCGPLALALPATGSGTVGFVTGRLAYNLGRIVTYTLLGVVFGLLGKSLSLIGVQRWLSIGAGALILAGLLITRRAGPGLPMVRAVGWLKAGFGTLLRRRTLGSLGLLGLLNGLLPCGLAYAACAGAAATGSLAMGTAYMALFGLGTVPLMLGIGLAGKALPVPLRVRLQQLVPLSLALVGSLLILRGMALGIPYLSPDLAVGTCAHCH